MFELRHWLAAPLLVNVAAFESATQAGFSALTLCQFGTVTNPLFAMVMIKRKNAPEQKALWLQSREQMATALGDEQRRGFGLKLLSVTGDAPTQNSIGNAIYSGIWEKMDVMPMAELHLSNATTKHELNDPVTLQGKNAAARRRNLRPSCVVSYGDSARPAFAGVWVSNTGKDRLLWGNEGLLDSEDAFRARDRAEFSVWCRPSFVALNGDEQFCSVYEAADRGATTMVLSRGSSAFEAEFTAWTTAGRLPISVQASGKSAEAALYAAIFVGQETPKKKIFTALGPVESDSIERQMEKGMRDSPVRDAALAVTYKKKLVYARGFTLAEEDWPVVKPTTRFRLASCSKTVTAFAVMQLIEEGKLKLNDPVQKILKLETPDGHEPVDPKFGEITIQLLLEHRSGLNPTMFEDLGDLEKEFRNEGKTVTLPVSADDMASFLAATKLKHRPGKVPEYSNAGYFLLGRVVSKVRGTATPIAAYQKHLLDPLGITRIRRAKDLVTDQEPGEARYQSPTLHVGSSAFPGFDLLPSDYGTFHLEVMDGDGGLTGAATDVVRLAAIVASEEKNPALKWSTILEMLNNGVINEMKHGGRAGYGFDGVNKLDGGGYYTQKGGSLDDVHSIFEVNGDWGLVGLWGGDPVAAPWYPFYIETLLTGEVKDALMKEKDWFPHFGMASL